MIMSLQPAVAAVVAVVAVRVVALPIVAVVALPVVAVVPVLFLFLLSLMSLQHPPNPNAGHSFFIRQIIRLLRQDSSNLTNWLELSGPNREILPLLLCL